MRAMGLRILILLASGLPAAGQASASCDLIADHWFGWIHTGVPGDSAYSVLIITSPDCGKVELRGMGQVDKIVADGVFRPSFPDARCSHLLHLLHGPTSNPPSLVSCELAATFEDETLVLVTRFKTPWNVFVRTTRISRSSSHDEMLSITSEVVHSHLVTARAFNRLTINQ
jgi:hypothetical protein